MIANDKVFLFADAEVGKDIAKYFIVSHFADDFGEVVDGGAEVFADEVAAEAEVEALLDFLDVGEGAGERLVVADVGDNDVTAGDGGECGTAHEELLEPVEVAP